MFVSLFHAGQKQTQFLSPCWPRRIPAPMSHVNGTLFYIENFFQIHCETENVNNGVFYRQIAKAKIQSNMFVPFFSHQIKKINNFHVYKTMFHPLKPRRSKPDQQHSPPKISILLCFAGQLLITL